MKVDDLAAGDVLYSPVGVALEIIEIRQFEVVFMVGITATRYLAHITFRNYLSDFGFIKQAA